MTKISDNAPGEEPTIPAEPPAEAVPASQVFLASALRGLAYGVLLIVIAIACASIVVPKIAGATPLTVLSNSMAPAMPVGSLSVVRPTMDRPDDPDAPITIEETRKLNDVSGIRIGDVITFRPEVDSDILVSHRVIAVSIDADGGRTFTTQGDNNSSPDAPVRDYQVRGVVWYHIPWLGYVNNFLNGENRRVYAVVISALSCGWALSLWVRPAIAQRRRNSGTQA